MFLIDIFFIFPLVFLLFTSLLALWFNRFSNVAPAPAGRAVYFFFREYLWMLLYFAAYVFAVPVEWFLRKTGRISGEIPSAKTSHVAPLVIIIHGYFSTPTHWLLLRARLKKSGYEDVIRLGYNPFSGSMEEWSSSFVKRLEPLRNRKTLLIGHSLGGLIAIRMALIMPEDSVAKVITLGSPMKGTQIARFAVSGNARRLCPGMPDIEKTGELAEKLKGKLVCFWSARDSLITPPENATSESGENVELEGTGHTGYHFDGGVHKQLRRVLSLKSSHPAVVNATDSHNGEKS